MTKRNIVECDRCHKEIKAEGGGDPQVVSMTFNGKDYDLDKSCARKVQEILSGADVEVPP